MKQPNKYTKVITSIAPAPYTATKNGVGVKKREWQWLRVKLLIGQDIASPGIALKLQHSSDDGLTDPYVDIPGGPTFGPTAQGGFDGDSAREIAVLLPATRWKHWVRPVVVHTASNPFNYSVEVELVYPRTSALANQVPDYSNIDVQATSSEGTGSDVGGGSGPGGGGGPGDPAGAGFRGFLDWAGYGIGNILTGGGVPDPGTGWTEPTQSASDLIYYVSTAGSSGNDGLTEVTPKATAAQAFTLLDARPDGHADWVLFKCDDVWSSAMPDLPALVGRSEAQPIVIGAYGTGNRPRFNCGSGSAVFMGYSGGSPRTCNHVALLDIHFVGNSGGSGGVEVLGSVNDVLIEGCKIEHFGAEGVSFHGWSSADATLRHTNCKLRRNVIVDNQGHGFFADQVDGILVEENIFDNNSLQGVTFAHTGYIQNGCTDATFTGNLVAGLDGVQVRCGGTIHENLFVRNSHALQVGAGADSIENPDGVPADVQYNCIIYDVAAPTAGNVGWGMSVGNIVGGDFYRNVIAHNTTGGDAPRAVGWQYQNPNGVPPNPQGMQNVSWRENIVYDWRGNVVCHNGSTATLLNFVLKDNDFYAPSLPANTPVLYLDGMNFAEIESSGNRVFRSGNAADVSGITHYGGANHTLGEFKQAVTGLGGSGRDTTSVYTQPTYTDPARSLASYNLEVGGTSTHEAYIVEARLQSKQNWRAAYAPKAALSYIMAGFDITIP